MVEPSQGKRLPVPPGSSGPPPGGPARAGAEPSDSDRALLAARWKKVDRLRPFQPQWRVRECGRLAQWGEPSVELRQGKTGWNIGHVHRCGSVWACPACAHQIASRRVTDVIDCVNWWRGKQRGNDVAMLTLTVRHRAGEDLRALRRALSDAWRKLQQSRVWQYLRELCGALHMVRCHDVTWSELNGFHPHVHAMLLCENPQRASDFQELITEEWRRIVTRTMGAEHLPSIAKAVKLAPCYDSSYVARLGLETSSPASKKAREGHLAPMQLADEVLIARGDRRDVLAAAWREYCLAMSGCHQVQWSRGLRSAFGCQLPDVMLVGWTIECEPEEEATHAIIGTIPRETWRAMALQDGLEQLDALGVAMVGASPQQCRDALLWYFRGLERCGCHWEWAGDTPMLRWDREG